jgi:hypothetical protein
MRTFFRRTTAIIAALALLVPLSAGAGSAQDDRAVSASVTAAAPQGTPTTTELRGTGGYWQKAACLGCVAGFLFVSGTGSVAAVIFVMAAYPEVAALCAAGCYAAYAI